MDVHMGQLLPRPTFGDAAGTMSACFMFVFFSGLCRYETVTCGSQSHHTKYLIRKLIQSYQ